MPLDRQSIEKKDFPIGRRGYDPEAVDAHLAWIAAQIEELKLSSRSSTETLATAAGEQVRAIVEAAAASAARIETDAEARALAMRTEAETHARELRTEAAAEADAARTQATIQSRAYVSAVSESTAVMLQRLDAMQSELSKLTDSLRTGANRLSSDLQVLDGTFEEVRGAVEGRGRSESQDAAPGLDNASPGLDGDVDGARLVALNMALNGTSREETDRYLAINFGLSDRAQLLNEVYSSVEG